MMDHKFIKKIEKTKKATVTLACVDKKEVKAHREILVKYSRFFQKNLGTAQRRIQIPITEKETNLLLKIHQDVDSDQSCFASNKEYILNSFYQIVGD